MFNYKYILLASGITLVFLNCAPSSYYLKNHNSFHKNKQEYNEQNISFFENNERNYFNEYENSNIADNKLNYSKDDRRKSDILYNNSINYDNVKNKIKIYIVRKGDTLFKISRKYNTTAENIASLNNIQNSNKIFPGMKLKIHVINNIYYSTNTGNTQIKKSNPEFIWPLKKVYSTKRDGLEGIKPIGIIITGKNNTSVLSSADGIVTKVGHMRGFGNYVILKHKNKYLTIYSNLKYIEVNEGDMIKKGKKIGSLNGNQLHFQIGYAGKPEDPFIYLSRKS